MAAFTEERDDVTFSQVPVNFLMDWSDLHKRVDDDVASFFKAHADEEEQLASSLARALRQDSFSGPHGGCTTSEHALLSMRSLFVNLARTHARYSRSIKEEMQRPMEVMAQQQHQHVKIKCQWNHLVKGYYTAREKLGKAKKHVCKCVQEWRTAHELWAQAQEKRGSVPFIDLEKIRGRLHRAEAARSNAERQEREAKAEFHESITARDEFIAEATRAYKQMEQQRITHLHDVMAAVARAEREHLEQRMRELEAFESGVAAVDPAKDLCDFVRRNREPDATHMYGRALAILDWDWSRRERIRRRQEGSAVDLRGAYHGAGGESGEGGVLENELRATRRDTIGREKTAIDAILTPLLCEGSESDHRSSSACMSPATSVNTEELSLQPDQLQLQQHVQEEHGEACGGHTKSLSSSSLTGSERAKAEELAAVPFSELIEHERGRAYFVRVLNERRGRFQNVGQGYDELAKCLTLFLDKCLEKNDVRAAQQAMQMANTFFRAHSNGHVGGEDQPLDPSDNSAFDVTEREYLLSHVKSHPIWRSRKLWEDALMLGVAVEMDLMPQTTSWDNLSHDAVREGVIRVHNVVFGQLGSLICNMAECGVPVKDVRDFITTMCQRVQLDADQVQALEGTIAAIATNPVNSMKSPAGSE